MYDYQLSFCLSKQPEKSRALGVEGRAHTCCRLASSQPRGSELILAFFSWCTDDFTLLVFIWQASIFQIHAIHTERAILQYMWVILCSWELKSKTFLREENLKVPSLGLWNQQNINSFFPLLLNSKKPQIPWESISLMGFLSLNALLAVRKTKQ